MISHKIAILILYSTAIVAIISVIVFNILVMARFLHDRGDRVRQELREKLKKKIFSYLNNPSDDLKKYLISSRGDIDILTEIAHDLLRNLKGASYVALVKVFADAGFYDDITKKLFSKDRVEYASVIGISSHFATKEIKQRLIELLQDESYLVRYSAAESLAYTHDIDMLPIIIKKFKKEEDLSYMMMANIFDIFGTRVSQEMVDVLQNKNTSNNLKRAALLILARHSNVQEVKEVFQPLCFDKDDELRAMVFFALAEVKIEVPLKLLEQAKGDKSWKVRQCVARCAAYNFPSSAEILADLLKDENWLVGLQAAQSLMALGLQGKRILQLISKNNSLGGDRAKMIMAEEGGVNAY